MIYQITNDKMELHLLIDNGIFIHTVKPFGKDLSFCSKNAELFTLHSKTQELSSVNFDITNVYTSKDETEELLSVEGICYMADLRMRLCFLNNLVDTVSIIFQFADDSQPDRRNNYYFHSPFLSSLHLSSNEGRIYYPKGPCLKKDKTSVLQPHPLIHIPLVLTDEDDEAGISVSFPTLSDLEVAVQNRNVDFRKISSFDELVNHSVLLRLNGFLSDAAEFSIHLLERGWREAFAQVRNNFCTDLDMREYEKEELKWFTDTFLHHFTFLYSKEAYDYEKNTPVIERLIEEGEEFGGYDTLTLWHQYPRLGVDSRSQWDFFRDFPESLPGIAKVINAAHKHGVRVLLPYKPWDISNSQSMDSVFDDISTLLKETDADGFFLDTMNQAPQNFRKAADAVKPDAIFCSEHHPDTADSLALLTASWDQFWNIPCMPEVDLLRFVLPAHRAPQISRWQNGADKDTFIKRAIFSGTGIVIWQDVFGSWLPYSPELKQRIRNYKILWHEFKDCFKGTDITPLYPTEAKGLYCNRFMGISGSDCIYTFYNDTSSAITGVLSVHRDFDANVSRCVWGDEIIFIDNGKICGTVPPEEVIVAHIS